MEDPFVQTGLLLHVNVEIAEDQIVSTSLWRGQCVA
jgi:hypothetical protein